MDQDMIDLHCHSTRSDGRLTPTALVARAAEAGVTTLALTDHDTVAGLSEARRAAASNGLGLISGVEISVTWQNRTLHIVGLGFDPEGRALTAGLSGLQQRRLQRAVAIADKLARLGMVEPLARAKRLAGGGQIGRPHFARLLVEDGFNADLQRAFKRYLRPGKPAHASLEGARLAEAIAWIRSAGGIAVLAHPFGYGFSGAWRRRAVAAFAEAGGEAIETATGTTDAAQEATVASHAREHSLMASIGSDFHAPEQRWLALGRLRRPPTDLTHVWDDYRFKMLRAD